MSISFNHNSLKVGTPGRLGSLLLEVTARDRSFPDLMLPMTPDRFWKKISTWPPRTAELASPPPLNGTCAMLDCGNPRVSNRTTIATC